MKKIILLFLFLLVVGTVFPINKLRKITKLEYDKNNNLIRVVESGQTKSKHHETKYIYNDENKVIRYIYNGQEKVFFYYSPQGKIKTIESYYGIYELNYKNGVIKSYDLINNRPEAGKYFIFSEEPVLNINQYRFLVSSVAKNGKVNVSKVTAETFGYSNQLTETIKNKNGKIIEKLWGSRKDNEYHVKYFKYDSYGNLIEVKAVNKVKIVPSLIESVMYIFAIMIGGYNN